MDTNYKRFAAYLRGCNVSVDLQVQYLVRFMAGDKNSVQLSLSSIQTLLHLNLTPKEVLSYLRMGGYEYDIVLDEEGFGMETIFLPGHAPKKAKARRDW